MGQSPPGVSYNRSGVGSPLINGPTEFTELHPVKVQWTTQPARFCRPGDLLICVRGSSTGRTNYADEVYAIGRGVAAIRAKADNDTQYLSYQVISGVSDILAAATGSTFPSVDGASFRKIRVSLPPPDEQRAIAEALSDVDGLLAALEELIAKKRAVKQAAMQQLLTGKTRLPGFSGAWETKRLEELIHLVPSGIYGLAKQTGQLIGMPVATTSHIDLNDKWNDKQMDIRYFTEHQITHFAPTEGDLIVVKSSGSAASIQSGKIGYVSHDKVGSFIFSNFLMLLRPVCCNAQFLFFQLVSSRVKKMLPHLVEASTYPNIRINDYLELQIPLPPDEEQVAIVNILSDMDAEVSALEQRRDKTRVIRQGMMQQLLTGRIRLVQFETTTEELAAARPIGRKHNWQFNEAVVISVLTKHFGNEQYPLGRMRYTKLSYLLHRHEEGHAEGYLKKAAGPYNPRTRYRGPEKIALEKDYVRQHRSSKGQGFIASSNFDEAEGYFDRWYGSEVLQWLERFRYRTNNYLELLTTVDMAAEELREAGEEVSVESVKEVIHSYPEWNPKLDRPIFSDANLAQAIESCQKLFDY